MGTAHAGSATPEPFAARGVHLPAYEHMIAPVMLAGLKVPD